MNRRRRGLGVPAIGATIAMLAIVAPAPRAGAAPQSACTASSGVTVIVDFSHFHSAIQRGCAPGHPTSALAALHAAGFDTAGTAQYGDAFLCRINGFPTSARESCARTPPASSSWSFYWAHPTDPTWTYSTTGVAGYEPPAGSLVAFAFGNSAKPGIAPSAVLVGSTTTTTSAARTTVAPVAVPVRPPTAPPPTVTAATSQPPVPAPASVRRIPPTTRLPTPATTRASASTMPPVDERAAAPRAPGSGSGSPFPAALTVGLVVLVGAGGLLTIRARRRRL
jgi:hypothetical protein